LTASKLGQKGLNLPHLWCHP